MQSEHTDTFRIQVTEEDISLLFGREGRLSSEGAGRDVRFTDRIVMNPRAAKRLLLLLKETLQDYEARFGPLNLSSPPNEAVPEAAKQNPLIPVDAVGMARSIVDLVVGLGVRVGMEWSFKMFPGTVLTNRLLIGLNKQMIKTDPDEKILALCREIAVPGPFLEIIGEEIPFADFVHFGFEETERGSVCKVYLEFKGMCERERSVEAARRKPLLLFLGLKWDPLEPENRAITEYIWHPAAAAAEIQAEMSEFLADAIPETPLDMAATVVSLAAARMPVKDMYLLEESEPGNPRKSFDLNVHRAGIPLKALDHFFARLCRHYEIDPAEFQTFLAPVQERILAHLTGGVDRHGRDFLTFYYGTREGQPLQGKNPFRPS